MKAKPTKQTQRESRATDVRLGRIVGRFGIRGELKVDPTRSGVDTLRPGLLVRSGERALRIESLRAHKTQLLLRFEAVDAEQSDSLLGADLFAGRDEVVLEDDEYFDDDLVGCSVVGEDGTAIGDVVDVLHYPGQDMLAVGARRVLIPLVGAFIRRVDVGTKRIDVTLPEGLLD